MSATGSLEGHLTLDNNKQVSPRTSSATNKEFAEDVVEVSADSTLDNQALLGKLSAAVVLLESKEVGTGISSRLAQEFFKIQRGKPCDSF
jgi:hypothetical protein